MKRNRKFTAVVVAVAGAAMAMGGVYATQLVLTTNQSFGGSVAANQCDTNGMTIETLRPFYSPAADTFVTTHFEIRGIAPACVGSTLYVTNENATTHEVVLSWEGVLPDGVEDFVPTTQVNSTHNISTEEFGVLFGVDEVEGAISFKFVTDSMPASLLGNWAVAVHDQDGGGTTGS